MELVSVVIPNYNNEKYLKQCVESVLAQSYKNIECIVVDDGSEDNSVELLSNLNDKRLIVLKKANGGLSSARNEGLKIAKGEYIAFLDSDDFWSRQKLENQMKVFVSKNPDLVFSNRNLVKKDSIIAYEWKSKELSLIDFINENPICGSSSSVLMKRSVYLKTGYFDLNLRSHEDIDYWYRAASHGFVFKGIENNDVYIRIHEGNMSSNNLKMFYSGIQFLDKALADFFAKKHYLNFKNKQIVDAVSFKLNRLRWKARDSQRVDLIYFTYIYGMRIFGLGFFFKSLNFKDFIYDLINFFLKRKFYKFRRLY